MATYKKRGFKNKATSSKAEALENKSTTANVFNTLDEGSSQTQQWVERNQNKILGLVAIISIIVIGVFAYSKLIKEPKESNAFNKMYFAQKKFDEAVLINNDSMYNIALNGDDLNMGMLQIIDEFAGTNAANLAHYYSGIMYLKMNDYPNSIKYLSEFSSDDILLSSLAFALSSVCNCFSLGELILFVKKKAKINPNTILGAIQRSTRNIFLPKETFTAS